MKKKKFAVVLMATISLFLCSCGKSEVAEGNRDSAPVAVKPGKFTLNDAIKAQTETRLLAQEAEALPPEVARPMRKVLVKAEAQSMAAHVFLSKDKYDECVAACQAACAFYNLALNGKEVLERLAAERAKVARAELLAGAAATPEQLREARRLLLNADGFEEAAEYELAIAELTKVKQAFEALIAPSVDTTLEDAVTARTAMLGARAQLIGLPSEERGSRAYKAEGRELRSGSLSDLVARARGAEAAAVKALADREYTPARALFAQAEDLYLKVKALAVQRDTVAAIGKTARESLALADKAYASEARPASFERGKQALTDGEKAFAEEELDNAKRLFSAAVEHFAAAQAEAVLVNDYAKAQAEWAAAQAASQAELMEKHAAVPGAAARQQAVDSETKARAGDLQAAITGLRAATEAFKTASAQAVSRENAARVIPLITRLKEAAGRKDKFAAETLLASIIELAPADSRLGELRELVTAVPWPQASNLDLGGGVMLDLVLIRPGKFLMGSETAADEKPVHEVTISQQFYLGKYEVTQAQWEAVMGSNPSHFKGATLPVECVSWEDCQKFIEKINSTGVGTFRLPTEAEWEYACRAGTTGDYAGNLDEMAWYTNNGDSKTHPGGTKKANPWGLYDMHGNVWEWCQDWYDSYRQDRQTDPKGAAGGSFRVNRGGCWNSTAGSCRLANRSWNSPSDRGNGGLGFRLVRMVP